MLRSTSISRLFPYTTLFRSIMCRARVEFAALERDYELVFKRYFSPELEQLAPLAADGLVVIDDRGLQVTDSGRSEEHTSELQSRGHLVSRLMLTINKVECYCSSW